MKVDAASDKTSPDAGQINRQVERILHSSQFSSAGLLRSLLSYLTERAIGHTGEHLKVKEIATHVFHRSEDFDSQTDSVVRVHVGRLRSKLAEFYMNEGAEDDVILEVPKGAYLLAFRFRSTVASLAPIPEIQPVDTGALSPAPLPAAPQRD